MKNVKSYDEYPTPAKIVKVCVFRCLFLNRAKMAEQICGISVWGSN